MVLERVDVMISSGEEQKFELSIRKASDILASYRGCNKLYLQRCVEKPEMYVINIEWDDIDTHIKFTKSKKFIEFRDIISPYFVGKPTMQHFSSVEF